jgi:hypothetical protein
MQSALPGMGSREGAEGKVERDLKIHPYQGHFQRWLPWPRPSDLDREYHEIMGGRSDG